MSVLVSMRVKVNDWDAFKAANDWYVGLGKPAGLHWSKVYRQESDPNNVLLLEEWDDHDSFHKSSDEVGDEFNKRAKTEGLEWVTFVWTESDAKQFA
jgi:quinol monooxygenase YgiN